MELKHKLHKENLNNPLYKSASGGSQDPTEADNRDAEGTSKMGQAGAAAKKKKKVSQADIKEAASFSKELKKEATSLSKDLLRKVREVFVCVLLCVCLPLCVCD